MTDYGCQVPDGVNDILADECALKRGTENRVRGVFQGHGFHEVSTPTFEYLDVFNNKKVVLEQEEMFKLIDPSGRILVLRPDVTVPIARMVSTNMKAAPKPLKLFYISDVYRVNQTQSTNQREFTQAGVEVIGVNNAEADGEIIAVAVEALLSSGLEDFRIDIGQVGFFESIIDEIDISGVDKKRVRNFIQHKNLVAVEEFLDSRGINGRYKDLLLSIPVLYGEVEEVLERAREFQLNNGATKALDEIEEVYQIVKEYGFKQYVSVDLGMVNEFLYYTGIIFKGFTRDLGYIICSGGRYDSLYEEYGDPCPATGFAINVNRVVQALKKQRRDESFGEKSYILSYARKDRKKAIDIAKKLRNAGYSIELDILMRGMEELMEYAKGKGVKGIIGIEEGSRLRITDTGTGLSSITGVSAMIASAWDDRLESISGWH